MIYSVSSCPCGQCNDWHVLPVAALQGVNFTERQARAVAQLLNQMETLPWHSQSITVPIIAERPR